MNVHEIYLEALTNEKMKCEKWEIEILKLHQELTIAKAYLQHHKSEYRRLQNIIDKIK
ncbi:hypothetical protein [Bacillus cereus]|uniref:hypothetical protein n=1 Tax=Bacillus cereus TaxID=1396 RepID=UPI0015CF0DFB|nr:hypothetical protein [Bacillus cereus]